MFRFTIRELVLLTLVVALGMGWWLDHRIVAARNDSLWSHMLRKDHALTRISLEIDRETAVEITKILQEEDEASRQDPAPLLRDGHISN